MDFDPKDIPARVAPDEESVLPAALTDSALETALHWARCLTADDEKRRVGVETLVAHESRDLRAHEALAEINDPVGIAMIREARNRDWATPQSDTRVKRHAA